jgi:hypothetical protein
MFSEIRIGLFLGGKLLGETVLTGPTVAGPELPGRQWRGLLCRRRTDDFIRSIGMVAADDDPIATKFVNCRHGITVFR